MSAAKGQKKQLSPKKKIALIVFGLLLFAFVGNMFLVKPKKAEAQKLDTEIAQIETEIATYRAQAFGAGGAGSVNKGVQSAELFRLAKAMPDEADMAGVILQLNGTAADTGIEFESISPQPSAVVGEYQVLPIALVFAGDFYSLSDFLFRLRNLVGVRDDGLAATGRLFTVDQLAFAEGTEGFPDIQATLTVSAYVFGTGAPASSTAPTTTAPTGTAPATTTPAPAPTPPPPAGATATGAPGAS